MMKIKSVLAFMLIFSLIIGLASCVKAYDPHLDTDYSDIQDGSSSTKDNGTNSNKAENSLTNSEAESNNSASKETADNKADNQGSGNQANNNQSSGNQSSGNQGGDNQGSGDQGGNQGGNQGGDDQGGDNQGGGNQGSENQGGGNQGGDNQGGGNQGSGNQGSDNNETEAVAVSAEIVNKNGAKGVLTLISDDGDQRTADFFYTKVSPKYSSFKITIALPTSKVATVAKTSDGKDYKFNSSGGYSVTMLANEYNTAISGSVFKKSSYSTVKEFWKKIVDKGTIEIASHSHSHGPWPATNDIVYDGGSVLWPKGTPTMELRASAQIIRNALGQETPFIMRPGGSFMTTEVSTHFKSLFATDSTYLGMRGSNGAPPFKGAISANGAKLNTVNKFKTQDGRLTIATILVRGYEAAFNSSGTAFATNKDSSRSTILNAGISAWKQYVDYAIQYGQWASIGFHSVVADSDSAEGYEVYDSQVMALMDYVQPLVDSGDIWLAHFADAAKYYFEWSSASVNASLKNGCIEVSLTDNEADSRFDEALTVKVAVPNDWQTAKLTTGGRTTSLTIHTNTDNSHFVYANIVPSNNISTISQ